MVLIDKLIALVQVLAVAGDPPTRALVWVLIGGVIGQAVAEVVDAWRRDRGDREK